MAGASLLEARGISKSFGGVRALDDVSFHLAPGEVLGLIGPNGAGKTTLINIVSGNLRASSGAMWFRGQAIAGLAPHRIAGLGIARSFQISKAFLGMTVEENVLVGALFGTSNGRSGDRRRDVYKILRLLGLEARRRDRVHTLNVADRKKVDLGRSLAMKPQVLLLDELMAGLNPVELEVLFGLLREINDQGVGLIIIEHVMRVIVSLCRRVIVLHQGQKIADGPPVQVMHNQRVIEAYLGAKYQQSTTGRSGGTS